MSAIFAAAIAAGAYFCILGGVLPRVSLGALGLMIGGLFGAEISLSLWPHPWLGVVFGIAGGALGCTVFVLFSRFGTALTAFITGAALFVGLSSALIKNPVPAPAAEQKSGAPAVEEDPFADMPEDEGAAAQEQKPAAGKADAAARGKGSGPTTIVLFALCCGALAVPFKRAALIASTSIIGSAALVLGSCYFILFSRSITMMTKTLMESPLPDKLAASRQVMMTALAAAIALSILTQGLLRYLVDRRVKKPAQVRAT